jgi:glyoxylase-like metal-dependent hydrolase (beta-lactamase superfamily II)
MILGGFILKITDGIYQVDGVNGNVYIVEDRKGLILVDTGLPRSHKKIISSIQGSGHKPTDVSMIVLTHFHIDHVGSLRKMEEATGARVAVHELDADYVAGKRAPPKPKNLMFRALSSFVKTEPVNVDLILNENDNAGRLLVIHTPGHSEGSISLLDSERKVMFVGDAVRFVDGKIQGPPEQFTLDMDKAMKSIGRIASFEFDVLLSGHGQALMPKASQKVKEFYATLK